jgi:hypothetical protein
VASKYEKVGHSANHYIFLSIKMGFNILKERGKIIGL